MDSPAGTAMLSMASYVYHTQELNLDQEGVVGELEFTFPVENWWGRFLHPL